MILFINVFLTGKRHSSFDRGRFGSVDALSAFRYMLRSLTDLKFSRAYIFAELDLEVYSAIDANMLKTEVDALFEGTQLDFRPKRLLALRDWQHFIRTDISSQSEPVFYSGNHDHVFVDRDCAVLDGCLRLMERLRVRFECVSLIMSHWAEYFSYRSRLQMQEEYGFVHTSNYRDAFQILTPRLMEAWFISDSLHLPGDTPVRRSEDLGWQGTTSFPQIIPGRELFRHIDGSSHFGVRIDNWSPLRVPPGLLEGQMKLAYIAQPDLKTLRHHQALGYCCISPHFPSLSCDEDGVDFHWLPDEIPPYMLRFATDVVQCGDIDLHAIHARDDRYAAMLRDMLPVSVDTLGRLAPHAIRAKGRNEPTRIQPPSAASRRTEGIFALKVPRGARQLGVVVIGTNRSLPHQGFWSALDARTQHSVYVWRQERANTAWHVQASAIHMAGPLYESLSGIYSYLFDFGANDVTPLRQVLQDLRCDQVVLAHQDALSLPGLTQWVGAQATGGTTLVLGSGRDKAVMLAFSVQKAWLQELLAICPDLYAAESMSLIEVLVHAAKRSEFLPEVNIMRVDIDNYPISPPAVELLLPP